jgi:hypothetical protein
VSGVRNETCPRTSGTVQLQAGVEKPDLPKKSALTGHRGLSGREAGANGAT